MLLRESADRFAAAFVKDLSQQPLGPAVVDPVKTFLKRIDELASSAEPGARKLYETLGETNHEPRRRLTRSVAAGTASRTVGGGCR